MASRRKGEGRETRAMKNYVALDENGSEKTSSSSQTDFKDDGNPSSPEWKLMMEMNTKLSSLMTNNKDLAKGLEDVKASLEFNDRKLSDATDKLTLLTNELRQQKHNAVEMENNICNLKEESTTHFQKLDELEQYTRKNSLEIHGIHESLNISCEEAVLKLANYLSVPLVGEDIEITHRLKRVSSNKPNPIIVKFVSHKKKRLKMYMVRTKLKNIKLSDILKVNEEEMNDNSNLNTKLFINENLTTFRKKLFWMALSLRRQKRIMNTWSIDGKILIKVKDTDTPIFIKCEKDLERLF